MSNRPFSLPHTMMGLCIGIRCKGSIFFLILQIVVYKMAYFFVFLLICMLKVIDFTHKQMDFYTKSLRMYVAYMTLCTLCIYRHDDFIALKISKDKCGYEGVSKIACPPFFCYSEVIDTPPCH